MSDYFKPSFKNHPLNYLFIIFVFFGSFSWSSVAFSFEDDGTYVSGKFYYNLNAAAYGPTKASACANSPFNMPVVNGGCKRSNGYIYTLTLVTCSASSNPLAQCGVSPTPVNNCPEKFTPKRLAIPVTKVLDADGNATNQVEGNYSGTATMVSDGCIFHRTAYYEETNTIEPEEVIGDTPEGDIYMVETYVSSGEPYTDEITDFVNAASAEPGDAADEANMATPALADSLDVVIQPTTSEIGPDGSQITSKTTVEMAVKGKGASVVNSVDNIVVTDSEGMRKTVTTTETEVVYPDGSKEVITERNIAYEQTDKTVVIITKADGTKVITNAPGTSAGTKSTKTDSYDPAGNLTSSSTTSADTNGSSQTGDAADAKQEGECKEDASKCKTDEEKQEQFCKDNPNSKKCSIGKLNAENISTLSFYTSAYPEGLNTIWELKKPALMALPIVANLTDIGISGSGSYPSWSFNLNFGGVMNLGTHVVEPYPSVWSFIALCFLITTLFLCRRLIFGG